MSNGYAADEPRHVEMAAIDEDIRMCAIATASTVVEHFCTVTSEGLFSTSKLRQSPNISSEDMAESMGRALRVLRHYGLLVEHGDGIVSVKEKANYEKS